MPKSVAPPRERINLSLSSDFLTDVTTERAKLGISLSEAVRQALRVWVWYRRTADPDSPVEVLMRNRATGETTAVFAP